MAKRPIPKPDDRPPVGGTMIFWNRGSSPIPGRNAVLMMGVIGMPKELAERFGRDEKLQHMVYGHEIPMLGMNLTLSEEEGVNYPEYLRSARIDELATAPIWRV